jgi:hypothetical protein
MPSWPRARAGSRIFGSDAAAAEALVELAKAGHVNASVSQTPLRPLGLGELLDRAVTISVKYVVPLSLIQLPLAIPTGIVRYFATGSYAALMQAAIDAMKASSAGKPANNDAFSAAIAQSSGGGELGWSFGLFFLSFFLSPLIAGALIEATSSGYFGRVPTFAESFSVGTSRWLNMIGVNMLYGFSGGAVYLVAVIVFVFLFLGLGFLTAATHGFGIAIDIIVGTAVAIVALGFFILAWLALQLSYFACIVERVNFVTAYLSGLTRILRRVGLRRGLIVGVAYFAAMIGIGLVSFVGQVVLTGLVRSAIAGTIFITIVAIVTAAFTTAFMTIFYFDVRVREEGLDLQIAADAMLATPARVS